MKARKIRNIAKKYGIALIYLFGSQAENGARYLAGDNISVEDLSDLDVAVAFENIPSEAIKIYGALYKEFSEIFAPFYIDLVFMHDMETLFQYEIIKGERIFNKDEFSTDEFEEKIMKMAEDLAFKQRIMNREILGAIEDGYFEFEYNPYSQAY
ncbi:MAG TPA: nucleotidyltransferase domain-containing protein [Candidatus Heimdallarchaeota archaeon]|nr:nucleotidyltransferase domain-containing protein [Candidatus Heimdallarchaeota archaeon]